DRLLHAAVAGLDRGRLHDRARVRVAGAAFDELGGKSVDGATALRGHGALRTLGRGANDGGRLIHAQLQGSPDLSYFGAARAHLAADLRNPFERGSEHGADVDPEL